MLPFCQMCLVSFVFLVAITLVRSFRFVSVNGRFKHVLHKGVQIQEGRLTPRHAYELSITPSLQRS